MDLFPYSFGHVTFFIINNKEFIQRKKTPNKKKKTEENEKPKKEKEYKEKSYILCIAAVTITTIIKEFIKTNEEKKIKRDKKHTRKKAIRRLFLPPFTSSSTRLVALSCSATMTYFYSQVRNIMHRKVMCIMSSCLMCSLSRVDANIFQ